MESSSSNSVWLDKISSFLNITAGHSVETARKYLKATNWELEQAIWLFYSELEVLSDPFKEVTLSDEKSNGTANTMADVSKNQRMEKEKQEYLDSLDRFNALKQWAYENRFNDFEQRSYLNRVNDFEDNLNRLRRSDPKPFLEHMELAAKIDNSENNAASMMHDQGPHLELMYRPPLELMYKGPLHDARKAAEDEDKWLIVNVQCKKEFSSQTLNLDTWANETVSQTISANFIFWQVYDDTPEGQKVCDYYSLKSFPAVLVLNPITRHMMQSWSGKIEPMSLLEDLVPFMDASPKQCQAKLPRQPEPVKKVAYPELPEEPKADEAETLLCRIEVYFPDGRRLERNFLRTDPIQFLWSFCSSQLGEAESRPFQLTQAFAGGSDVLDYESKQTFNEAGLLDSMIYVIWE